MSANNKVIVLLTEEEHATLKDLANETRRTLGQELAFRAMSAIKKPAPRRKGTQLQKGGRP